MSFPDVPNIAFVMAGALGKMIFFWVLVALAWLDAEKLWLPDWLTVPGIALGFILTTILAPLDDSWWLDRATWKQAAVVDLVSIALAAALILIIRWVYWLIRRREGIGLGDAKLMALLAAWLGFPGALLAFGLGVLLGSLAAVILLVVPSARRDSATWAMSKLPLGTFLSIGGIVSSLWGEQLIAVYLRWAGF
jgi:leader peptidase (prepilin peptidase)/N-methyltransferase